MLKLFLKPTEVREFLEIEVGTSVDLRARQGIDDLFDILSLAVEFSFIPEVLKLKVMSKTLGRNQQTLLMNIEAVLSEAWADPRRLPDCRERMSFSPTLTAKELVYYLMAKLITSTGQMTKESQQDFIVRSEIKKYLPPSEIRAASDLSGLIFLIKYAEYQMNKQFSGCAFSWYLAHYPLGATSLYHLNRLVKRINTGQGDYKLSLPDSPKARDLARELVVVFSRRIMALEQNTPM